MSFGLNSIFAMLLLVLGGVAQAQTSTADSSSTTLLGSGSSTSSVSDLGLEKKPRNYKIDFWFENDLSGFQNLSNGARVTQGSPNDNFLGAKYVIDDNRTIGFRQQYSYAQTQANGHLDWHLQDTYLNYVDGKLVQWKNDITTTGIFRVYIPDSEDARFVSKEQGSLVSWQITTKTIGKMDYSFHLYQQVYNQSQSYYTTQNSDGTLRYTPNPGYVLNPYLSFDYTINDYFGASLWTGPVITYYYSTPGYSSIPSEDMNATWILTYHPNRMKNVNLWAWLSDDMYLTSPTAQTHALSPFRSDDLTLQLILNFTI